VNDFNPGKVSKYRLKEEWIFNKKTSRLVVRILGIAPIEEDTLTIPGERLDKTLFWLYYPKLRPSLANAKVYNSKNHGARLTWEALFESRMFASSIVKSTMDNPGDVYVKFMPGLKDNPVLQLREGEKIRNAILDYEQNLWSY
jgi:gliding motility associated protien GldN